MRDCVLRHHCRDGQAAGLQDALPLLLETLEKEKAADENVHRSRTMGGPPSTSNAGPGPVCSQVVIVPDSAVPALGRWRPAPEANAPSVAISAWATRCCAR